MARRLNPPGRGHMARTVSLPREVWEWLDGTAHARGVSRSSLVLAALRAARKRERTEPGAGEGGGDGR